MTLALAIPADAVRSPTSSNPVSLLQLDARDAVSAAAAVYREVRRRRSVVVVAAGPAEAAAALVERLNRIGVAVAQPRPGDLWHDASVAIVEGPLNAPSRAAPRPEQAIRVALAGCGVVGGGVLARLQADAGYEVVGVLVREPGKARDTRLPAHLAVTDPAALLAREPDVLIEALSDGSTGLALIRAALARGVDVVSANKQAVCADPAGLEALAAASGARVAWSASVGGGSPLIETVRAARAEGRIVRIEAVLNGTCNFILNRLAEGVAFDAAVRAAQAAGFAEADPTADLSGLDAAAKLAILVHEAGGGAVSAGAVARETLTGASGAKVRQIACFDAGTGQLDIRFKPVSGDGLFRDLADEANALRVTLEDGRDLTATGRGAGRVPTVESVLADLDDLR